MDTIHGGSILDADHPQQGVNLPRLTTRHEPAEIYFIVSGRGEVDIGDRSQPVGPGCAIYIPPDVRHALRCTGAEPLVFVFAFPRDRFDEIAYHFER